MQGKLCSGATHRIDGVPIMVLPNSPNRPKEDATKLDLEVYLVLKGL